MKKSIVMLVVALLGGRLTRADLINGGFEADPRDTAIWYVTGWSFEGASGTNGSVIAGGSDGGKCVWFRGGYRGTPNVRLFQTFAASAGDILTLDYFWVSSDNYPSSDIGQGKILDSAGNVVTYLFSHSITEDPATRGPSVWTSVGYQFTSPGTYTLSLEVGNPGTDDPGMSNTLYVDNVHLLTGVTAVPTANAGADVTIYNSEQVLTTLHGSGTHTIGNTPLQYRWLEGSTALCEWTPIGADHAANLNLAGVPPLPAGDHMLTLEVKDAIQVASDTMTLTILDRAPEGSGLINGGFEAEGRYEQIWYITGWTFDSASGANGGTTDDFSVWGVDKRWLPTEGGCLVWIRSGYEGSTTIRLRQTFDASAGDALSFDYFWVVGSYGDPTGITIGAKLLNKAGGLVSTLFSHTLDASTPWSEWTSINYTFPASGTYTLAFEAVSAVSSVHLGIDSVVLNPGFIPSGTANAGPDVSIYTAEQAQTTLYGSGTHPTPGTALQYRWLEGSAVLQDWADVGADSAANLGLAAPVSALSIGDHTLTLEVRGGGATVSDTMTLTLLNTPPEGQPAPTHQVVEVNSDITIAASVADFDGDTLTYQWRKDGVILDGGTASPAAGGAPLDVPGLTIAAGDLRFPLGSHVVQLTVDDGTNPPVTRTATVEVQDTGAPTLAPVPSIGLLWPPNHELCLVTVAAHAADNSGGNITLTADVQSSEPNDGLPDQDWYIDSVDSTAGTLALRLRAERSGTGEGRVYTIIITATDVSGNRNSATVDIRVPHDQRKK